MPAAAAIFIPVVLAVRRIVGVARAGDAVRLRIVPGARIRVRDQHRERGAGGIAVLHPGDDAVFVGLMPRRRQPVRRTPLGKARRDIVFVDRDAGGEAVRDGADLFPVALTEERHGQCGTERVFHD